eukprot:10488261-Alexandrium_andersonii.AAC.1
MSCRLWGTVPPIGSSTEALWVPPIRGLGSRRKGPLCVSPSIEAWEAVPWEERRALARCGIPSQPSGVRGLLRWAVPPVLVRRRAALLALGVAQRRGLGSLARAPIVACRVRARFVVSPHAHGGTAERSERASTIGFSSRHI